MLTFKERYLKIVINNGCKQYDPQEGMEYNIDAYRIVDTRTNEKISVTGGQNNSPYTILTGKQPDVIRLEGKMCHLSGVAGILAAMKTARPQGRPILANWFLVGAIVEANGGNISPELNGFWIVSQFAIKRNVQKREFILFDLVLKKWTKNLPSM